MGLFGGGNKSTSTTTTNVSTTQDNRLAVGGDAGAVVGPGAAVGGAGAVNAAPYSSVTQEISMTGLAANDVQSLVGSVLTPVTNLASSIEAGSRETQRSLADVVAATKAPDQTALSSLLPLALLAVLLILVK
jgi:hypothetical protein